jgi:hypothetical protein
MANLKFVVDIIKKNSFQKTAEEHEPGRTFYDDIEDLDDGQLAELLRLLFESIEVRMSGEEFNNVIKALKNNNVYKLEDVIKKDIIIGKDLLVKFLICITFSEYRLDDILHYPGEMQYRRLQEIPEAVGVEHDFLLKIDSNWHSHVRKKNLAN